jgi:hypothetical protein
MINFQLLFSRGKRWAICPCSKELPAGYLSLGKFRPDAQSVVWDSRNNSLRFPQDRATVKILMLNFGKLFFSLMQFATEGFLKYRQESVRREDSGCKRQTNRM